jgi:soluble lytic murein transglycosylase
MVLRKWLSLCLTVSLLATVATAFPAKKRRPVSKKSTVASRVKRMSKAFVASADLRPMAEQLIAARTPAAYAGVQKFADAHNNEDAGALAWLVLGYAHQLDNQGDKAIAAFRLAQPQAGELRDYVDYFLAVSEEASSDAQGALALLRPFETRYPGSLFIRDAALLQGNALVAAGQPRAAVDVLEAHRSPMRADVELALARAQIHAGDHTKAVESLHQIYYLMPLAPEAADAHAELLNLEAERRLPPASFADRKKRAELLAANHHAVDAALEYKDLVAEAPPDEVYSVKIAYGGALWRSGRTREARELLEKLPETADELNAQRLYYLIELARPDDKRMGTLIAHLRQTAPESPWLQEALLATANQHLLEKDYATSARFFEELASRFPSGKYSASANWKAAWMQLREGDVESAKRAFERHVGLYPASPEASAALYWRGRLAEEEKNIPRARAYYLKVAERYYNSYYADLSRERLRDLGSSGDIADDALLHKVTPMPLPGRFSLTPPADNLRVQKSMLLGNCGLIDFAIRELQAAGAEPGENWATAQMIKLYTEDGHYDRALELLKRTVPGYYSFQLSALPRPFWEGLFPRPYWDNLKRHSADNKLDPFLVASLIRQESEFNPGAISRANAMGLMQILPKVGQQLAKSEKIKAFNTDMLLDPNTNIQLGTRYFKQLLDRYDGQVEYALAAYNAGAERVDEWRKGKYRDIHEFVESIPFTETREYVEAIVRNVSVYQRLYQDSDQTTITQTTGRP